jgi:outer membrane protein TolC
VAWPDEHWWEALHDEQLNQLVSTALSDNPSLRATLARVRQAEALAGVAQAATQPRVDASASADRELYSAHSTIPAPLAGNYAWKNTATLSGSYDLDLWGRNRDALAAALDEVHMAAAESQMARLTLETSIVRSYIQLSLAYTLQDSVAENLAQRQRILEITRRRKAQLASDIDVTSIETTLPAGRREHEQYGETIALLRNQLAALIGKDRATAMRSPGQCWPYRQARTKPSLPTCRRNWWDAAPISWRSAGAWKRPARASRARRRIFTRTSIWRRSSACSRWASATS